MKPEEVDAMTDGQLRIKAAELVGWTHCVATRLGYVGGYPPGKQPDSIDKGHEDTVPRIGAEPIPDYPNDIAEAWELVEKLREMERYPEVQNVGIHGHLWNVWLDPPPPKGGDSDLIAQDEDAARAIARAFILAME